LEIARFLAPATTAYAVFEALRALLSTELRRRRLARQRGHAIICGDDTASWLLAQYIRREHRRPVILIGSTRTGRARRGDIDVIQGDGRDEATLRAAGIGSAVVLYACGADGGANAAAVLAAAQLRGGGQERFEAYAQIDDDDLGQALRVRQLAALPTRRTTIDFFSLDDIAARAVLAESTLTGTAGPATIIGSGFFAMALLRALVRNPGTAGAQLDVVVHTDDLTMVSHAAERLGAAERVSVAGLADPVTDPSERIFVCLPDEENNLGLASRLLRGPGRRVVACLRRAAPFAEALKGTDGLWLVGVLDEACRPDRIEADAIVGRAARAIHRRYVQERIEAGDTADTNASICEWEDLPSYLQESNYAQAEHIGVKLHEIGAGLTIIRPAQHFTFQPGEIEKLAKIEHRRWMDERIAAGFVHGPSRTAREHPDLVDWPNLPAESKQKDIDAVKFLPELLEQAGIFLTRFTDSAKP
jgi:hypothetical protein